MVLPRYAGKVAGIKGIDEARAGLREIIKEIKEGGETAGPALDKVTAAMMPVIDSMTPVDTGRLVSNNKRKVINNFSVVIYNETPYAGYVHDGTSRMPARPFMENGINELKQGIPDLYIKNASEFIKRVEERHKPT